jgi:hypothetical protein
MANAEFQRSPKKGKFDYQGVDFHHPQDMQPPRRAPFLLNVDPTLLETALQARPGNTLLASVNAGQPIHSIKRLNDMVPGAVNNFARFVGSQGLLFGGQTSFLQIDDDYSGNPLAMVPYRPPQSPEPWMYVFDSLKTQKFKADLVTKANIGIFPSNAAPVTALSEPSYTIIEEATVSGSWAVSGDAGTVSTAARVPSGVTASAVVYDTGTSGWACVGLTGSSVGYGWLGLGMRIEVDSENTTVEQVFTTTGPTTVAAVVYDSGSTGLCTVAVAAPQQALVRNQLLKIDVHYVRVLSVTTGPDGSYSFRTNTGSGTIAEGLSITFVPGFRAYLASTHTSGATMSGNANTSALTYSSGTGLVSLTGLTLNLTETAVGTSGISLIDEDYMHMSFWTDTPASITEIHIFLDVDASENNFTQNYYYYIARQGDFTSVVSGASATVPALLTALTTDIADSFEAQAEAQQVGQSPYPVAPIANPQGGTPQTNTQLPSGTKAWFEATFKFSDLTRVGSDASRTLANVAAIGVQFIITGNANVEWGSWWVGGGYGPDANFNSYGNQGIPIQYRFRYRSSTTGAISDVSPETRNGELPRRQQIGISLTASTDPQVDLIDIERFGGPITQWKQVLTVPNTTGTYLDSVTTGFAEGSQALDLKQYVPFPVTDSPQSGIVNIVGTRVVLVSGDEFNVNWIRGVEIIVNNQTYTLYAPPGSTTVLDTAQNIGVLTEVPFSIPEATIAGQALPYAWESKGNDRIMACGDPYNPGLLYFTNSGNPDSASDSGYIEVTNPSEPLLGGGHYEGADYVFTTDGVYRIEPSSGANPFASYKLSLTYGIAGAWAFCVDAPLIFLVTNNGDISAYNPAGASARLTDDLYPLFPFEGQPGIPINIPYLEPNTASQFYPPNFNLSQFMRLEYVNEQLFFDYVDTTSTWHTFRANGPEYKSWVPYYYNCGGLSGQVVMRYQEEGVENPMTLLGTADGNLYYVNAASGDGSEGIECIVATPADDQGDSRMLKQYGDVMMDFQGTVAVQPYFKQFETTPVSGPYILGPQFPRGQWIAPIVSSGTGTDTSWQRNIGLVITWTTTPPS